MVKGNIVIMSADIPLRRNLQFEKWHAFVLAWVAWVA